MEKYLRRLIAPLWLSLLFVPFGGIKGAATVFIALVILIPSLKGFFGYLINLKEKFTFKMPHLDKKILPLPILLLSFSLPLIARDYVIDIAILACIYIILAQGLNIIVGFTGLLNLGFAAYYAIGAYTYAILTTRLGFDFWSAAAFSVGLSALSGFLLAIPALRLRGDYLAIVTLGFGEIVHLTLKNWDTLTSGPNGIAGIPPPSILGISFGSLNYYYYFVLVITIATLIIINNVHSSKIGRAWISIREDEIASSAMGINTTAYKLYSFAFGALWAGLAGALFAAKMRFVSPESFTFMESVIILCMVILGGIGSIAGAAIGAVVLVVLPELLRDVQHYRMLALGAGLIALMIFRPQGILGGRGVSIRD
jgi:branched-chain amino acid transport system permease protein